MIRGPGLTYQLRHAFAKGIPVLLARLLVDKGVREFVQSAQILRKRGVSKDVRFVVVGKPDLDNPHIYIK